MQKSQIPVSASQKATHGQRQTTPLSPLVATLYPVIIAGVLFGVRYVTVEKTHRPSFAATAYTAGGESGPSRSQNHESNTNDDSALSISPLSSPSSPVGQRVTLDLQPIAAPTDAVAIAPLPGNMLGFSGLSTPSFSTFAGFSQWTAKNTNQTAAVVDTRPCGPSWLRQNPTISISGTFYVSEIAPPPNTAFFLRQTPPDETALTANLSALTGQLVALRTFWQSQKTVASPAQPTLPLTTHLLTRGMGVNLINNGSFETNTLTGWVSGGTNYPTPFDGGLGTGGVGSPLTSSLYGQPAGGSYCAVIYNDTGQGFIAQSVSLVAGTSYTLAFDDRGTGQNNTFNSLFDVFFTASLPASGSSANLLTSVASVGFTTISQTTPTVGNPNPPNGEPLNWTTVHESFFAPQTGAYYLTFLLQGGGSGASDTNFDRVALISSDTPEPASLALLVSAFLTVVSTGSLGRCKVNVVKRREQKGGLTALL